MSSLIGALRVTLGADTADFERGMTKAELAGQRAGQRIRKSLDGAKSALGGFLSGVSLAALTALSARALDYASSLGEVAQQLGVTTGELQEYRYAASQVGIEQDAMDKGLQKLTRTIGQAATGGKAQKKVFDDLGISIRDASGHVRTAGDVMPEIADALAKIPEPARRAAVETQLFGRAGQQLDTLLAGGSKAMNELRKAAHDLGIVLSEDEIQKADETADKLAEVKQVLEAKIAGAVSANAQSIVGLADALGRLTGAIVQFLGSNPARAAALIGALAGGSIGGAQGAVVGAVGGYAVGSRLGMAETDATLAERRRQRGAASRFLAGRSDLSSASRAQAERQAYALIDKRLGVTDEAVGPFGLRRVKVVPRAAATPPPPAANGGIDLEAEPDSGVGGKRKASGGASNADRERKDALREQYRNDSALRDLQIDELRAREDLTYDIKERGVLAQQQLDLEQAGERAQVEYQVKLGELTRTEADKQLASLKIVHGLQQEKLARDEQFDLLEEQRRQADQISELTDQRLQIESDLARTARERREIEMRILDHRLKEERAAAQRVLDDPRSSVEDRSVANRRLLSLDNNEAAMREQVRRRNMTPIEGYLDSLPKTAAEANEALENVAAGGIQSVVDGLTDAMTGARSLGDVFRNVAKQIIADLIRIQIQKAIVGGLSKVLGGLGGGVPALGAAKAGTLEASFDSTFASRIPGLAGGGIMSVGGKPGVDTNLLSINGVPRARVSANERVAVIPEGEGMGATSSTVHVVPSPYFDVVVEQRASRVAAPMAVASGQVARAGAQSDMQRRARRRIPG